MKSTSIAIALLSVLLIANAVEQQPQATISVHATHAESGQEAPYAVNTLIDQLTGITRETAQDVIESSIAVADNALDKAHELKDDVARRHQQSN